MAIQRLLFAVRASPFWRAGKSLTESCANQDGFGGGVDMAWYLRKYRKITQLVRTPADCIEHYAKNAAGLVLSPNLVFDEKWYRHTYPDADAAVQSGKYISGWEHYLTEGASRQLNPAFWFEERWYQRRHHEAWCAVSSGSLNCGFEHYLLYGVYQDLQPSLYFHPVRYRREHTHSNGSSRSYPVVDYLLSEDKAAKCPAPFFDENWYQTQYLSTSVNGDRHGISSGFEHYLLKGRRRGYSPSPRFNEMAYRKMYPDAARLIEEGRYQSGFEHYAEEGVLEGRNAPTHFDVGGVDYARPDFLRSYERSLRLNFQQFRRMKELVEKTA